VGSDRIFLILDQNSHIFIVAQYGMYLVKIIFMALPLIFYLIIFCIFNDLIYI